MMVGVPSFSLLPMLAVLVVAVLTMHGCESKIEEPSSSFINGASLGGLFVLETTWMYDQFNFPAENDFIHALIAEHNVSYAIQTMKNHWSSYYPTEAFDGLRSFGITHVRLPVSFFTFETPVSHIEFNEHNGNGPATMYNYGLNPEGYVTGGVNALEKILSELYARNIFVLLDMHTAPGVGSQCSSYAGMQLDDVSKSLWRGSPEASITSTCSPNTYTSSRPSNASWMQVGLENLKKVTQWAIQMNADPNHPNIITHLEIINEPALHWPNTQDAVQSYTHAATSQIQQQLRAAASHINVTANFIWPNEKNIGAWYAKDIKEGKLDPVVIDYHHYYNWAGNLTMEQLISEVCALTTPSSPWAQYPSNGFDVVIGEWSLASNLDNPKFTNISDPTAKHFLKTFHANQMSAFYTAKGVVGQFYWTVRMGSGWDPRPTPSHPFGHQVNGTAYNLSLPSYQYRDWNLSELIRVGIASPLSSLNITGVCECNGCIKP
eukprot:m.3435 g.3435  ORF g.3435 m.3435 type:complete len:491 (-) comp2069_c0_seq2:1488-2960(-)